MGSTSSASDDLSKGTNILLYREPPHRGGSRFSATS